MRNKVIALRKKDNWFHENILAGLFITGLENRAGKLNSDSAPTRKRFLAARYYFAAARLNKLFNYDGVMANTDLNLAATILKSIAESLENETEN